MAERKKTRGTPAARKPAARPAKGAAGAKARAKAPAGATRARAAVAAAVKKGEAVRKQVEARGAAAKAAARKAAGEVGKAAAAVAEVAEAVVARARKAVKAVKAAKAAKKARGLAARPPARPRAAAEPDPESYFVARVRGEEAVRDAPHPMTEAAVEAAGGAGRAPAPEAWDEQLGDLPWSYGDDVLVALPRDPRTLFVYWEHQPDTVKRAFEGLQGARAELWIFVRDAGGGWERVRVVDLALESRGWYVHELDPGRVYRAEIHLVDAANDRLLPRPSNEVALPPAGPSPVVDDRFARLRWEEHLSRWLAEWKKGGPFAEELRQQLLRLSDWSRFAGETWGGTSAGGMGGRPSSPTAPPGSPSSPWGGAR